jgi:hypothetical protein
MNIKEKLELELDHFIDTLRTGELNERDMAKLDERLRTDPDLRSRYRARMRMESNLLSVYQSEQTAIVPPIHTMGEKDTPRRWWYMAAGVGIAATLVFSIITLFQTPNNPMTPAVARVEVQSEASWSGNLPINQNGELSAGIIDLRTGVAEIRFASGVRVSLEAPVRLDLIDPMRCRLLEGSIIVEVPNGAEGFIVDTPEGHAVDYGTNFAVTVDKETNTSEFGVISGEIAVHHTKNHKSKTLLTGEAVRLTAENIVTVDTPFGKKSDVLTAPNSLRLRTNGRETSIIRNDQREQWLSPDLLMVKADVRFKDESQLKTEHIPKDRRSLFGFDLGELEKQRIRSAKIRLNIVPSGLGFASFLPETSHFEIYGIRDKIGLENCWTTSLNWADAPGSVANGVKIDDSEVELLGTFEIPKGRQEGSVTLATDRLVDYLVSDTTGEVGFLVVMTNIPKREWSLVHAFASSSHHHASGPTLEIELEETKEE